MAQKTFTLFLFKNDVRKVLDIFSNPALDRINGKTAIISENFDFTEEATVYYFTNYPHPPSWLNQLAHEFPVSATIQNQSSSAVLAFRAAGRLFAATFGYAWQYLDPEKFVPDFGLRVALNAANDDKLNRLDIANLGEATRGVTQSASQRRFDTFGLDEALELVRKISGAVRDDQFGNSLSGSNSLKINKEMELSELPDIAQRSLKFYLSTQYKNTAFRVIDNICPELDKSKIDALNDEAAQSIANDRQEFELGLPDFSEDEVACFSFVGFRHRHHYVDLQLSHYTDLLGDALANLSGKDIKQHKIKAEYLHNANLRRQLSIHDALVGSLEMNSERYAINEGKWYKVDAAFKNSIDNMFYDAVCEFDDPPPVIMRKANSSKTKQYLENEVDYNKRYASENDLLLMDREFITVSGFSRSQFEICDLLDIRRKRLIHVKMSGRNSSVLSHLFKQGANSARLVKSVDEVWPATIKVIQEKFGSSIAQELEDAIKDTVTPWSVEFHIADSPRPDGQYSIPFFSRVTFRDELIQLRAMGYRVAIRFIPKPKVVLRTNIKT